MTKTRFAPDRADFDHA